MKRLNSVDRIYKLRQLFLVTSETSRKRDEKSPRKSNLIQLNNLEQDKAA